MEYAQLNQAGTEAIQITTHSPVEWDANNFCSAEALVKDGKAEQFRVVPLLVTEPPAFDQLTQTCIRDGCEKVGDAWQYKWHIDDFSAEQIAENQAAAQAAVLATYDKALTDHLDAEARTHRYDNRINCALRAGYAGPYHAEGVAFAQWMDSCNAAGYAILEDFQAGRIPQPTVAEVIATLPVMVWPA